jgi:quercetin dioxygenase-like cupin family protein
VTALDDFLRACEREIARRLHGQPKQGVLTAGHAAFQAALDTSEPIDAPRGSIPVAEHLGHGAAAPLLAAAQAAGPELSWIASSRLDDNGTEAGLAPLNDVRDLDRSDWGHVQCGLMLLRPHGTYPLHSHPPQELYLPISGDGQWRYGGSNDFCSLAADALVYNHPNDVHSVVAGDEPLLALYVLWRDRSDG